eukprot:1159254-Pelagomonas_calceolata.AAC.1
MHNGVDIVVGKDALGRQQALSKKTKSVGTELDQKILGRCGKLAGGHHRHHSKDVAELTATEKERFCQFPQNAASQL